MKIIFIFLILSSFASSFAQKSNVLFEENFKSYSQGSDGSPVWHAVKGLWQIQNKRYEQHSTEYDCASMLDQYMDGSFELQADFEHLAGETGMGFIFASQRYDGIAFSQMVRFDGGTTFIMGYFQNGEFTGTASAKASEVVTGSTHTLSLIVNRVKNIFTVSLDGKKITESEIPLTYAGGYVGLQSSAGKVRFHRVTLTRIPSVATSPSLDWVNHFAITSAGTFVIPDERAGTVKIVSQSGDVVRVIGSPAKGKGQLERPFGIALLDSSSMVISDRGNNKLHKFTLSGIWKASTGWKGSGKGLFDEPSGIAVNAERRIFVADKQNNRVQVFDDSLNVISEFGSKLLKTPVDISVQGSQVFVLNTGLSQVELFHWNRNDATWQKSISYGGGEARGIDVKNDILYISVVNQVRAYDTTGTLLHTVLGRSIDFLMPQGITVDDSTVYIADYFGGRIVKTTHDLLDPEPIMTSSNPTGAVIEWATASSSKSGARLLPSGQSGQIISDDKQRRRSVSFTALQPMTTYHYQVTPTLETIPGRKQYSRTYSLTTSAGPKTKLYARLPMATILFTNVHDDTITATSNGTPAPLDITEIDRIKKQIRDGIRFYWIHSGMNLFLDMDFIVVNERLLRSDVYGSEWWYPPRENVLEQYLKNNGKDIKHYSGIVYLTCPQTFDTSLHKFIINGKGGGFTTGVGTGEGYGISWWEVTKKNHNAGNNWLMVHEFNHQLDDIFMASGYPEYWFNHISPTIGTAAMFGEHFDANAHILRMVDRLQWLDLRYTTLASTRDLDEDGIPDNDPNLPFDEVRLQSDSTTNDTDRDGVSDLSELTFSNWLTEGWGETYGGNALFPNLRSPDTDGDGISDKNDPYPCYSETPQIIFEQNDAPRPSYFLGSLTDVHLNASIAAKWNTSSLMFSFELDRNVPVKLMLDAGGDGWFVGRGNYFITLNPVSDTSIQSSTQLFNATLPASWPFMDKSLSDTLHITTDLKKEGKRSIVTVTIPKNNFMGLTLSENDKIGISMGFLIAVDGDGTKRYINLFEPNRFFTVRLVK